jgi:predicted RNA-binding Zn-ribbon protein involved in translation (DUF1610 family)
MCRALLDVRESIKNKPYVVCDPCGMQMFIRKEQGIASLKNIIANGPLVSNSPVEMLREKIKSLEIQLSQAKRTHETSQQIAGSQAGTQIMRKRISELEELILRICPNCGKKFEIRDALIRTSWMNGKFQGYQCPKNGCAGIASPKTEEKKK